MRSCLVSFPLLVLLLLGVLLPLVVFAQTTTNVNETSTTSTAAAASSSTTTIMLQSTSTSTEAPTTSTSTTEEATTTATVTTNGGGGGTTTTTPEPTAPFTCPIAQSLPFPDPAPLLKNYSLSTRGAVALKPLQMVAGHNDTICGYKLPNSTSSSPPTEQDVFLSKFYLFRSISNYREAISFASLLFPQGIPDIITSLTAAASDASYGDSDPSAGQGAFAYSPDSPRWSSKKTSPSAIAQVTAEVKEAGEAVDVIRKTGTTIFMEKWTCTNLFYPQQTTAWYYPDFDKFGQTGSTPAGKKQDDDSEGFPIDTVDVFRTISAVCIDFALFPKTGKQSKDGTPSLCFDVVAYNRSGSSFMTQQICQDVLPPSWHLLEKLNSISYRARFVPKTYYHNQEVAEVGLQIEITSTLSPSGIPTDTTPLTTLSWSGLLFVGPKRLIPSPTDSEKKFCHPTSIDRFNNIEEVDWDENLLDNNDDGGDEDGDQIFASLVQLAPATIQTVQPQDGTGHVSVFSPFFSPSFLKDPTMHNNTMPGSVGYHKILMQPAAGNCFPPTPTPKTNNNHNVNDYKNNLTSTFSSLVLIGGKITGQTVPFINNLGSGMYLKLQVGVNPQPRFGSSSKDDFKFQKHLMRIDSTFKFTSSGATVVSISLPFLTTTKTSGKSYEVFAAAVASSQVPASTSSCGGSFATPSCSVYLVWCVADLSAVCGAPGTPASSSSPPVYCISDGAGLATSDPTTVQLQTISQANITSYTHAASSAAADARKHEQAVILHAPGSSFLSRSFTPSRVADAIISRYESSSTPASVKAAMTAPISLDDIKPSSTSGSFATGAAASENPGSATSVLDAAWSSTLAPRSATLLGLAPDETVGSGMTTESSSPTFDAAYSGFTRRQQRLYSDRFVPPFPRNNRGAVGDSCAAFLVISVLDAATNSKQTLEVLRVCDGLDISDLVKTQGSTVESNSERCDMSSSLPATASGGFFSDLLLSSARPEFLVAQRNSFINSDGIRLFFVFARSATPPTPYQQQASGKVEHQVKDVHFLQMQFLYEGTYEVYKFNYVTAHVPNTQASCAFPNRANVSSSFLRRPFFPSFGGASCAFFSTETKNARLSVPRDSLQGPHIGGYQLKKIIRVVGPGWSSCFDSYSVVNKWCSLVLAIEVEPAPDSSGESGEDGSSSTVTRSKKEKKLQETNFPDETTQTLFYEAVYDTQRGNFEFRHPLFRFRTNKTEVDSTSPNRNYPTFMQAIPVSGLPRLFVTMFNVGSINSTVFREQNQAIVCTAPFNLYFTLFPPEPAAVFAYNFANLTKMDASTAEEIKSQASYRGVFPANGPECRVTGSGASVCVVHHPAEIFWFYLVPPLATSPVLRSDPLQPLTHSRTFARPVLSSVCLGQPRWSYNFPDPTAISIGCIRPPPGDNPNLEISEGIIFRLNTATGATSTSFQFQFPEGTFTNFSVGAASFYWNYRSYFLGRDCVIILVMRPFQRNVDASNRQWTGYSCGALPNFHWQELTEFGGVETGNLNGGVIDNEDKVLFGSAPGLNVKVGYALPLARARFYYTILDFKDTSRVKFSGPSPPAILPSNSHCTQADIVQAFQCSGGDWNRFESVREARTEAAAYNSKSSSSSSSSKSTEAENKAFLASAVLIQWRCISDPNGFPKENYQNSNNSQTFYTMDMNKYYYNTGELKREQIFDHLPGVEEELKTNKIYGGFCDALTGRIIVGRRDAKAYWGFTTPFPGKASPNKSAVMDWKSTDLPQKHTYTERHPRTAADNQTGPVYYRPDGMRCGNLPTLRYELMSRVHGVFPVVDTNCNIGAIDLYTGKVMWKLNNTFLPNYRPPCYPVPRPGREDSCFDSAPEILPKNQSSRFLGQPLGLLASGITTVTRGFVSIINETGNSILASRVKDGEVLGEIGLPSALSPPFFGFAFQSGEPSAWVWTDDMDVQGMLLDAHPSYIFEVEEREIPKLATFVDVWQPTLRLAVAAMQNVPRSWRSYNYYTDWEHVNCSTIWKVWRARYVIDPATRKRIGALTCNAGGDQNIDVKTVELNNCMTANVTSGVSPDSFYMPPSEADGYPHTEWCYEFVSSVLDVAVPPNTIRGYLDFFTLVQIRTDSFIVLPKFRILDLSRNALTYDSVTSSVPICQMYVSSRVMISQLRWAYRASRSLGPNYTDQSSRRDFFSRVKPTILNLSNTGKLPAGFSVWTHFVGECLMRYDTTGTEATVLVGAPLSEETLGNLPASASNWTRRQLERFPDLIPLFSPPAPYDCYRSALPRADCPLLTHLTLTGNQVYLLEFWNSWLPYIQEMRLNNCSIDHESLPVINASSAPRFARVIDFSDNPKLRGYIANSVWPELRFLSLSNTNITRPPADGNLISLELLFHHDFDDSVVDIFDDRTRYGKRGLLPGGDLPREAWELKLESLQLANMKSLNVMISFMDSEGGLRPFIPRLRELNLSGSLIVGTVDLRQIAPTFLLSIKTAIGHVTPPRWLELPVNRGVRVDLVNILRDEGDPYALQLICPGYIYLDVTVREDMEARVAKGEKISPWYQRYITQGVINVWNTSHSVRWNPHLSSLDQNYTRTSMKDPLARFSEDQDGNGAGYYRLHNNDTITYTCPWLPAMFPIESVELYENFNRSVDSPFVYIGSSDPKFALPRTKWCLPHTFGKQIANSSLPTFNTATFWDTYAQDSFFDAATQVMSAAEFIKRSFVLFSTDFLSQFRSTDTQVETCSIPIFWVGKASRSLSPYTPAIMARFFKCTRSMNVYANNKSLRAGHRSNGNWSFIFLKDNNTTFFGICLAAPKKWPKHRAETTSAAADPADPSRDFRLPGALCEDIRGHRQMTVYSTKYCSESLMVDYNPELSKACFSGFEGTTPVKIQLEMLADQKGLLVTRVVTTPSISIARCEIPFSLILLANNSLVPGRTLFERARPCLQTSGGDGSSQTFTDFLYERTYVEFNSTTKAFPRFTLVTKVGANKKTGEGGSTVQSTFFQPVCEASGFPNVTSELLCNSSMTAPVPKKGSDRIYFSAWPATYLTAKPRALLWKGCSSKKKKKSKSGSSSSSSSNSDSSDSSDSSSIKDEILGFAEVGRCYPLTRIYRISLFLKKLGGSTVNNSNWMNFVAPCMSACAIANEDLLPTDLGDKVSLDVKCSQVAGKISRAAQCLLGKLLPPEMSISYLAVKAFVTKTINSQVAYECIKGCKMGHYDNRLKRDCAFGNYNISESRSRWIAAVFFQDLRDIGFKAVVDPKPTAQGGNRVFLQTCLYPGADGDKLLIYPGSKNSTTNGEYIQPYNSTGDHQYTLRDLMEGGIDRDDGSTEPRALWSALVSDPQADNIGEICESSISYELTPCLPYLLPGSYAAPVLLMIIATLKDVVVMILGFTILDQEKVRRLTTRIMAAIVVRVYPFTEAEAATWATRAASRFDPRRVEMDQFWELLVRLFDPKLKEEWEDHWDQDVHFYWKDGGSKTVTGVRHEAKEKGVNKKFDFITKWFGTDEKAAKRKAAENEGAFVEGVQNDDDEELLPVRTNRRILEEAKLAAQNAKNVGVGEIGELVSTTGRYSAGNVEEQPGFSPASTPHSDPSSPPPPPNATSAATAAAGGSGDQQQQQEEEEGKKKKKKKSKKSEGEKEKSLIDMAEDEDEGEKKNKKEGGGSEDGASAATTASASSSSTSSASSSSSSSKKNSNNNNKKDEPEYEKYYHEESGFILYEDLPQGEVKFNSEAEIVLFKIFTKFVCKERKRLILNPEEVRPQFVAFLREVMSNGAARLYFEEEGREKLQYTEEKKLKELLEASTVEVVAVSGDIWEEKLTPQPWMVVCTMLYAFVNLIILIVDTAPMISAVEYSFDIYQNIMFMYVNSGSSIGTLNNALMRRVFFGEFDPLDPLVIASFLMVAPPLFTHIIPGAVLYFWMPLSVVLLCGVGYRLVVVNSRRYIERRAASKSRVGSSNLVINAIWRNTMVFVANCVMQACFNYALLFYLQQRGSIDLGGYGGVPVYEYNSRSLDCSLASIAGSITNAMQMISGIIL